MYSEEVNYLVNDNHKITVVINKSIYLLDEYAIR